MAESSHSSSPGGSPSPPLSQILAQSAAALAKMKRSKKGIDSYTICGTNEVVRVGDCVLLRACYEDEGELPAVGRVEKMDECGCGSAEVRVRWYYRPENTRNGRRRYHGEKEVFITDHCHTKCAHDILGKCVVHSLKDYTKLDIARPGDFFFRLYYEDKDDADKFTPIRVKLYCKCRMPYNPDFLMVKCQSCTGRFHPSCIGMTIQEARKLVHFICSNCLDDVPEEFSENISALVGSPVVPGVPIDYAPTRHGENSDVAKRGQKHKVDTTPPRPKKKKKMMMRDPMAMQVSRLIGVIDSSKNKSERVKDEIIELLQQVVNLGAKEGSDEHFTATKLFVEEEYRIVFRSFGTDEGRMAWLKRMFEDTRKN